MLRKTDFGKTHPYIPKCFYIQEILDDMTRSSHRIRNKSLYSLKRSSQNSCYCSVFTLML